MGNALIVGRGGGGSASSKYELKTEIYEADKLWVVPKAKDQKFSIRIFGGGGCGDSTAGGGGGFMNNGDLTLSQGSTVQITIGLGGNNGQTSNSGGTTSFGTYLSANGGGAAISGIGGSGGSGGGGTIVSSINRSDKSSNLKLVTGGIGYQFGGGGCGGSGGYWGGGGGSAVPRANTVNVYHSPGGSSINYQYNSSNGRWYDGGGGGLGASAATVLNTSDGSKCYILSNGGNGTNTISIINDITLSGNGIGGTSILDYSPYDARYYTAHAGGGGGGYGGNGGNNGGGGGGYGANGGHGVPKVNGSDYGGSGGVRIAGGGGGGYGKGGYGGNAIVLDNDMTSIAGGGGGYGPGGDGENNGVRGGGAGADGSSGGNGICIIQYYA